MKKIARRTLGLIGKTAGRYTVSPRSGLNNQKMMLLGLYDQSVSEGWTAVRPRALLDFSPATGNATKTRIPFADVFDPAPFDAVFTSAAPTITQKLDPAGCFQTGAQRIASESFTGDVSRSETARFLASFQPSANLEQHIARLRERLPVRFCGVQMRIETDWRAHLRRKGLTPGRSESIEIVLEPSRIFQKIRSQPALDGLEDIVIFCDESVLAVGKDELAVLAARHGLRAHFKSDISMSENLSSSLQNSFVDFNIGLLAQAYVGLSMSTFSNVLCIDAAYRAAGHPQHFIYDAPSDRVEPRLDYGRSASALDIMLAVSNNILSRHFS